jgi:hypothetical protein
MYNSNAAIYGLKYHSRCIASQLAEADKHRFLVGTTCLRASNEIHLLEYHVDVNEITCQLVISQPGEVWKIDPHPTDSSLLTTIYLDTESGKMKSSLWKLPDINDTTDINSDAIRLLDVESTTSNSNVPTDNNINGVFWNVDGSEMISFQSDTIEHWKFDGSW